MPPKRVRKPTKGKPGKGKPVKAAPALTVPPEEVSQDLPPREAKLLREISVSPRSEPGPMPGGHAGRGGGTHRRGPRIGNRRHRRR